MTKMEPVEKLILIIVISILIFNVVAGMYIIAAQHQTDDWHNYVTRKINYATCIVEHIRENNNECQK